MVAPDSSESRFTPAASRVAAQSGGVPLPAEANENTSTRCSSEVSSIAGALAWAASQPAPAVLIRKCSRVAGVSHSPARPQSSMWLLPSTQQSTPAAARQPALDIGAAACDAGFEIDDACVRRRALEFVQGCAPDVGKLA